MDVAPPRYRLAAAALKAFSLNGATKSGYRWLGNRIGGGSRSKSVQSHYIARAHGNLAFLERNGAVHDGMAAMELGTGWVHWEALFTRLFYDIEVTLFDVWDNRQFDAFLHHARTLGERLEETGRPADAIAKARELCGKIAGCRDFGEAYDLLGFTYIIAGDGSIGALEDASLDLVFSSDVMEHIPADTLPRLAGQLRRKLRTGGHATQQIVQADHLCIYARSAHPKTYLAFDDRQWRRWFENDVQYFNRWQHSDFVELFSDAGFAVVDQEIVETADTSGLDIAERWRDYDRNDLDATVTRLLVQNRQDS